jgi:NAD(P)-dependent dehydrogenase (short-subunit alcohol dehydrogenase family)
LRQITVKEGGVMRLENKVAIITGGGKGIGKAISFAFSREGATVIVTGRTYSALKATCDEIVMRGGKAYPIQTDISDEQQVISMVTEVVREFGRIDILVNNAGITGPVLKVADMDLAKWNETIAINLTGSMICVREALKDMVPRKSGNIINIVSEGGRSGDGRSGYPWRSAYCSAKMGLIGLTETLSIEVGEYNIRVNAISPAAVKGERFINVRKGRAAATNTPLEEVLRNFSPNYSLRRPAEETEIAGVAVFLASDESSCITGQTVATNCGQHIIF